MDLGTLQDAAHVAFRVSAPHTPGWPSPHPDRSPLDEEYSRCLDPGKYRIVSARCRAWTEALVAAGLAQAFPRPVPAGSQATAAIRIQPNAPDGLALTFATGSFPDSDGGGVAIHVGDADILLTMLPACGCDACDDGSDRLLDALDEWVTRVVGGSLVVVDLPGGGRLTAWDGGMEGSNVPDRLLNHSTVMQARAGTSPYAVTMGVSWLL